VNLIVQTLFVIIITECFFRLPFRKNFHSLISIFNKTIQVIRSKNISDHWKEQVILRYSQSIFILTVKAAIYLGIISTIFLVAYFLKRDLVINLTTSFGLISASITSLAYIKSRSYLEQHQSTTSISNNDYGLLSKFLHYLALSSPTICEISFDIEQTLQSKNRLFINDNKHVFIAGLARAGTTILMRRFYSSNQFCSITYNDMPFTLMPNLWSRITSISYKQSNKSERAHGDGLLIDYNSPEALEEVFWRVFSGKQYIKSTKLVPMSAEDDVIEKFRMYVNTILSKSDNNHQCYLSKNNNNILRLESIRKAFPKALIIIPYRDPLQQANSLLRIHNRFIELHKKDRFVRQYMQWLVHHEFGYDHKPFSFHEKILKYKDTYNINYWLQLWIDTYSWLSENAPENALFLSYENFCTNTEYIWSKLTEILSISDETLNADTISLKERQITYTIDEDLLTEGNKIYSKLNNKDLSAF